MNITETLDLSKNIGLLCLQSTYYFCRLLSPTPGFIRAYLVTVTKDTLQVAISITQITVILVLICFIKSLAPRYNYCRRVQSQTAHTHPNDKIRLSDDLKKSSHLNWFENLRSQINHLLIFIRSNIIHDSIGLKDECKSALSLSQIGLTLNQLSWSKTQSDIESVNWLNQLLNSLWRPIKTILYKFVIFDILRPIPSSRLVPCKQPSDFQTKLSTFISTRRKLDQLRVNAASTNRDSGLINVYWINATIYTLKCILLYMKQFVIDTFTTFLEHNITNTTEAYPKTTKSLRDIAKNFKKLRLHRRLKFNPRLRRKSQSAPFVSKNRGYIVKSGFFGTSDLIRSRERRLRLAETLNKALQKSEEVKNNIILESICLGESAAQIEGIRLVEDRGSHGKEPTSSDQTSTGCMKIMTEISYRSDEKFYIRMKVPILGTIKLNFISIQLRMMIKLNHNVDKNDRNLDIMQPFHGLEQPLINHIQIMLADVPQIDWNFQEVTSRAKKHSKKSIRNNRNVSIAKKLKRIFSPITVIDHPYFKYLIHTLIRVFLQWFKPFDIRISDKFYLKTLL